MAPARIRGALTVPDMSRTLSPMETYTKLFSSIVDSTIWCESSDTKVVWITLLALADRHGYVPASVPGLAKAAAVSVDAVREALAKFMAPDPDSRSQEYEGRRVDVADRGWLILNYERFRDMRDEEARKEYERERKREQRKRARVPDCPALSPPVPEKSTYSQAEAEAKADTDQSPERAAVAGVAKGPFPADLTLTAGQLGALEMIPMPPWAITELVARARTKALGSDKYLTPAQWRSWLSSFVCSAWNDPKQRPKPPRAFSQNDDADRQLTREERAIVQRIKAV